MVEAGRLEQSPRCIPADGEPPHPMSENVILKFCIIDKQVSQKSNCFYIQKPGGCLENVYSWVLDDLVVVSLSEIIIKYIKAYEI